MPIATSSEQTAQFSISAINTAKIYKILQSQLYSNKIGSVIREYCTNAVDAHKLSKSIAPFDINIISNTYGNWVSIRDYGNGLSAEMLPKLFSEYGSSTKENSLSQAGMFGIGCKSGFAVSSVFSITNVFEGNKYFYCSRLNKEGMGVLDLLYTEPTKDKPGIEVKIPFAQRDYAEICNEILQQLSGFDLKFNLFVNDYKVNINEFLLTNIKPLLDLRKEKPSCAFFPLITTLQGTPLSIQTGNSLLKEYVYVRMAGVLYPVSIQKLFSVCSEPVINVIKKYIIKSTKNTSDYIKWGARNFSNGFHKHAPNAVNNLTTYNYSLASVLVIDFELDDIDIIASREGLEYTTKTMESFKMFAQDLNDYISKNLQETLQVSSEGFQLSLANFLNDSLCNTTHPNFTIPPKFLSSDWLTGKKNPTNSAKVESYVMSAFYVNKTKYDKNVPSSADLFTRKRFIESFYNCYINHKISKSYKKILEKSSSVEELIKLSKDLSLYNLNIVTYSSKSKNISKFDLSAIPDDVFFVLKIDKTSDRAAFEDYLKDIGFTIYHAENFPNASPVKVKTQSRKARSIAYYIVGENILCKRASNSQKITRVVFGKPSEMTEEELMHIRVSDLAETLKNPSNPCLTGITVSSNKSKVNLPVASINHQTDLAFLKSSVKFELGKYPEFKFKTKDGLQRIFNSHIVFKDNKLWLIVTGKKGDNIYLFEIDVKSSVIESPKYSGLAYLEKADATNLKL